MLRWILQVFVIGIVVYVGFQNRYRLLNILLSNEAIRRFLVTSSLNLPMLRDRMMQSVFNRS